MTERTWEEYVEDREAAESEERWLASERRDWAQAVIEKLEGDVTRLNRELHTNHDYANRHPHVPANWEAVAENRGELFGIRTALKYLREDHE